MDYETLADVATWLLAGEAADYQAGVLLLQQHGRNRGLVAHLLKKESPGNREKLTYELLKLGTNGDLAAVSEVQLHFAQAVQGAVPPPAAPPAPTAPELPAEEPAPEQVPDALRAQVDDLSQFLSKLHRERCQLSNSLADLDPAQGPAVVARILDLQNQYNALAEKRRRLLAGSPPAAPAAGHDAPADAAPAAGDAGEPAAPAVDRAELTTRRNTLRANISKTKGKLGKAQTEAKRSELSQKLGKLEVELTDVEVQLKAPQA